MERPHGIKKEQSQLTCGTIYLKSIAEQKRNVYKGFSY